ncbi:hypothetical protein KY290_017506 [Solanum tuberosum]|uniref:Uncharacterized protein n=1 Tax=Solanum tuberosum TaxID=4113 RepID=A0ABQ7VBF9_SOLTU|nr:hypothetical protein KY290_017506 [Solanum tuberosum]
MMLPHNDAHVDFSFEDHGVLPPTDVGMREEDTGVDVVLPNESLGIGSGSDTNIEVLPSNVTGRPNTNTENFLLK